MKTAPSLKVQVWIHGLAQSQPGVPPEHRFLILRTRPDRGGFWQPVTGSVESGEDLEAAASREAREETGLSPEVAPRPVGRAFSFRSRDGREVREHSFHFSVKADAHGLPPAPRLDGREHDAALWVSGADAYERIQFDSNREILAALLQELGGEVPAKRSPSRKDDIP